MNEPIRECPFCGGVPETLPPDGVGYGMHHIICCRNYGPVNVGVSHKKQEKAIAIWNNRPVEDALRAALREIDKSATLLAGTDLFAGDGMQMARIAIKGLALMASQALGEEEAK